jgi:hypothetical protein
MLRSLYRSVVPFRIRKAIERRGITPGRIVHRLRWHLASPDYISRWTDRRLQLGDDYWLFILGLNNSGTSILHRILRSHPLVRRLPLEGQALTRALPHERAHGVDRNFTSRPDLFRWTEKSDPAPALRIRYDWSYHYARQPGVLLEKSPPNTLRARWLQRHFQPSRFIAIIRHPYAVCEGIRRERGYPIEEIALHWVRGNECLLSDIPLLEWCLLLSYEDLCERPEEHLDRIERFLELALPFDKTILTAPIRVPNIDGRPHPIQNFNAKSLERLSPSDIETINRIAGPLMAKLGYESL